MIFRCLFLGLVLSITLDLRVFGDPQPDTERIRQLDRKIEALASRNKEPRILCLYGNDEVPLFIDDYDWDEQARISGVLESLEKDKSDQMWWCLMNHLDDQRYALTGNCNEFVEMTAYNFSVGSLCKHIAGKNLGEPYARYLPAEEWRFLSKSVFHPQYEFWDHKEKWVGKPLYEIQIAVCQRAIEQMALAEGITSAYGGLSPARTFTAEEKAKFIEDVKKEIEQLQHNKKAITSTNIKLPDFCVVCNANHAKLARSLLDNEENLILRLFSDLASHNKAPQIVRIGDKIVPLFPEDYDWSDQDRVLREISSIARLNADLLWPKLFKCRDTRYALTVSRDGVAMNLSVKDLCKEIAAICFSEPYWRNMQDFAGDITRVIPEQDKFESNPELWLADGWKSELYQLQISGCEWAIGEMTSNNTIKAADSNGLHTVTAKENARFKEDVEKEIQLLRDRKTAIRAYSLEGLYKKGRWLIGKNTYNAEIAKQIRETYGKNKKPNLSNENK
jgi:hypothetical protein